MHPAFAGDRRIIEKLQQNRGRIQQFRQLTLLPLPERLEISGRVLQQLMRLNRRVVRKRYGGNFRGHFAVVQHPNHRLLQHLADHRRLQAPATEALHQHLLTARLHHEQHAFLGFGQQKLVGRHALFTGGNPIEIQFNAQATLSGHLGTTAGQAGGPHVLRSDHITTRKSLETGFDQAFLQKRIAHLHGRTIIQGIRAEFGTGETGTAHAITPRGAAHIHNRVAHALRTGFDDLIGLHQPQGHGIDQGIAGIGGIERHLTANGGHAHAVAVVGNARHHAFNQPDIDGILEGAEPQRIKQGNRTGTHGEDVPQNPANARRRTLKGLHSRRVVVALDLERQTVAFAEIHHAGVLARTHQNSRPIGGKTTQQRS